MLNGPPFLIPNNSSFPNCSACCKACIPTNVVITSTLVQVDHATPMQKKTFGLALSIILTLRMPQVLDKLDQILRYRLAQSNIKNLVYLSTLHN